MTEARFSNRSLGFKGVSHTNQVPAMPSIPMGTGAWVVKQELYLDRTHERTHLAG